MSFFIFETELVERRYCIFLKNMEERGIQTEVSPPMEDYEVSGLHKDEELTVEGKENISFEGKGDHVVSRYPLTVYILVGSMLCEHLSESGLKSLMAIYFEAMLGLEGNQITVALHSFNFLQYFAVLIGAVLSDSYFGKISMVFYSQLIYSVGTVLLAASSVIKRAFPNKIVLIVAMISKIVGLGGILPCLIPLAADQITEKVGNRKVKTLFTFYFVSVQVCDIVSVFSVPIMKDVPCFNLDTCYPLAIGCPAVFSIVAFILFSSVKKKCLSDKPRQPIVIQGIQCIFHGLEMKLRKRKTVHKSNWLDYADDSYDANFIEAVKNTLNVLAIPIPLYWSLYDQQATTWTMQAARMDNDLGFFRILPGQVQALCPTLLLVFIPLFHSFLYDLLSPLRVLNTLLKRMVVGGFLIAIAFFMAFLVELGIENSLTSVRPENEGAINIFNGIEFPIYMTIGNKQMIFDPESFNRFSLKLNGESTKKFHYTLNYSGMSANGIMEVKKTVTQKFFIAEQSPGKLTKICDKEEIEKDPTGQVKVRLLCSHRSLCKDLKVSLMPEEWFLKKERTTILSDDDCGGTFFKNVFPGVYRALAMKSERTEDFEVDKIVKLFDNQKVSNASVCRKTLAGNSSERGSSGIRASGNPLGIRSCSDTCLSGESSSFGERLNLKTGGSYALLVRFVGSRPRTVLLQTNSPNVVSVLWLIPQYVTVATSAVLFTISAYSFIYTETPALFKSFSWSACYMTLSVGNMVTVLVGGAPLRPSLNFLLFAGIMLVGMVFFLFAAHHYKYVNPNQSKNRIYPFH